MKGFGPLFGMLVDRVEALLADKGYDADSTHERFCTIAKRVAYWERAALLGAQPVNVDLPAGMRSFRGSLRRRRPLHRLQRLTEDGARRVSDHLETGRRPDASNSVRRSSEDRQTPEKVMSQDRHLQEAVLAEFLWEPSVSGGHIGVTAKDGIVTLTGHVENYLEKRAAEKAAARVKGVKGVAEEIKVQLHSSMARSDEQIAKAAVDRLAWEVTVPRDAIKVKVEEGYVTLTGQVEWHFQQEAAERCVRGLIGVIGIFDQTTIMPRADVIDIGRNIDRALHRSWFDPETITVTANGGKVTLTGTVGSPGERSIAGATAWGAAGATDVENDLIIA